MENNRNSDYLEDDVEKWYPKLKDYTFKTLIMDMNLPTAKAIINRYEKRETADDNKLLDKLEEDIDHLMSTLESKKAFVRLSTRSPKDYALRTAKTKKILSDLLQNIEEGDEVNEIIAIIQTMSYCLQMTSGKEAVEFMINSERVYQDLSVRILETEESTFNMKVIIREWVDIRPELEFRGFFNNKQFNALTQYYKACYVPEIAQRKDEISKLIQDFYEKIKGLIDMNSFVADFAVVGTTVYLVELNTFGITASPSLFDWKVDTQVMHNGPFQFRVVMQPYQNGKSLIARPLRHLMAGFRSDWQDKPKAESEGTNNNDNNNVEKRKNKKDCVVQ